MKEKRKTKLKAENSKIGDEGIAKTLTRAVECETHWLHGNRRCEEDELVVDFQAITWI